VQAVSSTPSRGSRAGRAFSYDLTALAADEDEEMTPRTPRNLKRTAAELSSPITTPPGSPSVHQYHRKNARNASVTAAAAVQSIEHIAGRDRTRIADSPFLAEDDLFLGGIPQEQGNGLVTRSSPFVQQLLETTRHGEDNNTHAKAAQETAATGATADFAREASVIEMRKSEAEAFFSTTPRKQVVVVDLVQGQDDGSEGWETDNDDSPQSRKQSRAGRQNPDIQSADFAA